MRAPAGGEGHFTWLHSLPFPEHVSSAVLVTVLLTTLMFVAGARMRSLLKTENGGLVPDDRFTFLNFFEILAEGLYSLTEGVMGPKHTPRFYPLIGTLFVFILVSNILGLIPGFLPPTDNLNTTLALAGFVFLYYNYVGFKEHGPGYIKHFMGPVWWLAPMLLVLEVISHLFRPVSLALRLRGNMYADHMVITIFNDFGIPLIPTIFYGMGLFVSVVQTLVFCLLTMVYISLAVSHDH